MIVKFFASVAEKTGCTEAEADVYDNLGSLRQHLISKFPEIADIPFVFTVNRIVIHDLHCPLNKSDEVALLPPFSGG
jgi:molybdopterin converting factor small subunit